MNKEEYISILKRELMLRNYADNSVSTYCSCLSVFLDNYKKFNGYEDIEDIKSFLLTVENFNYRKQFVATVFHFFRFVVGRPLNAFDLPYGRKTHYLPFILSVQEVFRLVNSTQNIKHKAILQLMYSCALRISEVVKIEICHIDKDRKLLLVKGAKGFKDRYIPLPEATLVLLRSYYIQYRPKKWLFNGQSGEKYTTRSIQQIFKGALLKASIIKPVTPHSMRHSRLTHLCEADVDIYKLKEMAGHNQIKTTEIYIHLAKGALVDTVAKADHYLSLLLKEDKLLA